MKNLNHHLVKLKICTSDHLIVTGLIALYSDSLRELELLGLEGILRYCGSLGTIELTRFLDGKSREIIIEG